MAMDNFYAIPERLIKRNHMDDGTLAEYRTEFMRDRDRIMYATAFKRLAGKTQIYTVGADDHRKNRLTHTLEVSQIARTIATALNLNTELAEAIALAHDFGHTPFGHAGEEMLHEIMIPNATIVRGSPFFGRNKDDIEKQLKREKSTWESCIDKIFGFKHNLQSVRVAAVLEDSYRGDHGKNIGLNLTNYTLYGIQHHSNLEYSRNGEITQPNYHNLFKDQLLVNGGNSSAWSLEAYVVALADEFAQWHHDLEDAIRGNAMPIDTICSSIEDAFRGHINQDDQSALKRMKRLKEMDRRGMADLSHIVINTLVNSLVETSKENMANVKTAAQKEFANQNMTPDAQAEKLFTEYEKLGLPIECNKIIDLPDTINIKIFRELIRESVHHSRNVERMNEKGKYIIRKLFEAYYAHPQQLPDGPILHFLVERERKPRKSIDDLKAEGIGRARSTFEEIMKNPTAFDQCILMRRICDHIASMTDRYAIDEYNDLYG
jgi:dGTPase